MFQSYKLYIQISRNKITVVNLDTGDKATRSATEPFSTRRSVLSSFNPANETLLAAMRDLSLKKSFFKTKAVIQQWKTPTAALRILRSGH